MHFGCRVIVLWLHSLALLSLNQNSGIMWLSCSCFVIASFPCIQDSGTSVAMLLLVIIWALWWIMALKHGEMYLLGEIAEDPKLHNEVVRITGSLSAFDAEAQLAVIEHKGAHLLWWCRRQDKDKTIQGKQDRTNSKMARDKGKDKGKVR
jgi:hypothetical protein